MAENDTSNYNEVLGYMNEINNIDSEQIKDYREETAFKVHQVAIEEQFDSGTIEITPELAKLAKLAIEKRLTENFMSDNNARIDMINESYCQYFNTKSYDGTHTALGLTDTYTEVENWVDDLYKIFSDFASTITVDDPGCTLEDYLTKSMEINDGDIEGGGAKLSSLLRVVDPDKYKSNTTTFYFKKADIIKSFLKYLVDKSGFKLVIEDYARKGVISGEFCCKDVWGDKQKYKLNLHEQSGEGKYITYKSFKYEIDEEDTFKFVVPDTRNLLYPRSKRWVIEKFYNIPFSELLTHTIDENGDQMENSIYDLKQLKKIAVYLKNNAVVPEEKKLSDAELELYEEVDDLYEIEGEVTLWEAHYLPLSFDKKVHKTLIVYVNIGSDESPNLLPIRIQKTPYVRRNPYHFTDFICKDNGGMSLPQMLRKIQEVLNKLNNHSTDLLELGLLGILFIDPDSFEDITDLKQLIAKKLIFLKGMKGRKIGDIFQWMHPPSENMQFLDSFLLRYQEYIKKTSRNNAGQKILPNPTATEAMSIIEELGKTVNKVALRLNDIVFLDVIESMYIYSLLNRQNYFEFKAKGYRQLGQTDDEKRQVEQNQLFKLSEKTLKISPAELFTNGIKFKINAVNNYNKQAVQKQQAMQAVKLLFETGGMVDPATGQPVVMTDETGTQVTISKYRLYKKILTLLEMDDVFEKYNAPINPMIQPMMAGAGGGTGTGQIPKAPTTNTVGAPVPPPLNSEATPAAIATSVTGGMQGGQ